MWCLVAANIAPVPHVMCGMWYLVSTTLQHKATHCCNTLQHTATHLVMCCMWYLVSANHFVSHDSFMCVPRLHLWYGSCKCVDMCDMKVLHTCVKQTYILQWAMSWHESSDMMTHGSHICMRIVAHADKRVRQHACICVSHELTWVIDVCDNTHAYVCASFTFVAWLMQCHSYEAVMSHSDHVTHIK